MKTVPNEDQKGDLILVVDDEPLVREMLSRRLAKQGYTAKVASNADEALSVLSDNEIALVLLDVSMPGRSGMEVLADIESRWPDTMVIMVTAISDVKTAIDAMRIGAYDYLIKPVDIDIMILSVTRALEKRHLIMENREYHLNLEEKVQKQTKEIRNSYLNTIKSLAFALEAKDKYTHGHSERVTNVATALAEAMQLPQETIEKIKLAGLVHDIGKIGVKEDILNKAGKLTTEEYEHIKTHCEIGNKILEPVINDDRILDMVTHHHERMDGKGYPHGLTEGQISIEARILMTSDAYDAMSSDRPYRKALDIGVIRAELEKGKGSQFDPAVVDLLLHLLDEGKKL
ncbi:MAG TPA: HD domain-containing phosphohydrolase [Dehalococcoidia bacterium]|nr:HD domain-containing phosphohydrolase [Dehalococcoidia bacterium]